MGAYRLYAQKVLQITQWIMTYLLTKGKRKLKLCRRTLHKVYEWGLGENTFFKNNA
jgi:hypothetical protein